MATYTQSPSFPSITPFVCFDGEKKRTLEAEGPPLRL